jgi:hypothetical protein
VAQRFFAPYIWSIFQIWRSRVEEVLVSTSLSLVTPAATGFCNALVDCGNFGEERVKIFSKVSTMDADSNLIGMNPVERHDRD